MGVSLLLISLLEFVSRLLLAPIFKENGVIQIGQRVPVFGRHKLEISLSRWHRPHVVFELSLHVRALFQELQDPVIGLLIRAVLLLSHQELWIPELDCMNFIEFHLDIIQLLNVLCAFARLVAYISAFRLFGCIICHGILLQT